jgi:hypothetical protein
VRVVKTRCSTSGSAWVLLHQRPAAIAELDLVGYTGRPCDLAEDAGRVLALVVAALLGTADRPLLDALVAEIPGVLFLGLFEEDSRRGVTTGQTFCLVLFCSKKTRTSAVLERSPGRYPRSRPHITSEAHWSQPMRVASGRVRGQASGIRMNEMNRVMPSSR